MKLNVHQTDFFVDRHHSETDAAPAELLTTIGIDSIGELINYTVPALARLI